MPRTALYDVRTKSGISFQIEAHSQYEAERRAHDPLIARHIAHLMREALEQVDTVEPHRGAPRRCALVFDDQLFRT